MMHIKMYIQLNTYYTMRGEKGPTPSTYTNIHLIQSWMGSRHGEESWMGSRHGEENKFWLTLIQYMVQSLE
jgi:hypothetical protein